MKLLLPIRLIVFTYILYTIVAARVLYAQEERGYLAIKGQTLENNKPLSGVTVVVIRNGKIFSKAVSDKRGKFNIPLEYFSDYSFYFEKEGYFKLTMAVNTRLPIDLLPLWSVFEIKIPMFKLSRTDVDEALFSKPIVEVSFDTEKKKFTDLNQGKVLNKLPSTPVNNNDIYIPEKMDKEPVSPYEKQEELKQEIRKNVADKRREENELMLKIKKANKETNLKEKTPVIPNKTPANEYERKYAEENVIRQQQIEKSLEMNQLFQKKSSRNTPNLYQLSVKEDKGIFTSSKITLVYKDTNLVTEFKESSNFWGTTHYYINNKEVTSTEYFIKIKTYIK